MPVTSPTAPTGQVSSDGSSVPLSVIVRDLDVRYRVYEEQSLSARELIARGFRTRRSTTIEALNGVSFDVHIGEAVGIVGSNGSGKSPLLRTVAGLQSKAAGTVMTRGEVQLLGVGAALKPLLSGNRNVVLGGLAMGLPREQIEQLLPGIAQFSGLGDAMTRPLNTYSSGMRARLAFSIATLRVPDVLLIDEALAVGDKEFRAKSLERINEIREQAGTVLMVTHNLSEVRATCTRAVWLDRGSLRADGPVDAVLDRYEHSA